MYIKQNSLYFVVVEDHKSKDDLHEFMGHIVQEQRKRLENDIKHQQQLLAMSGTSYLEAAAKQQELQQLAHSVQVGIQCNYVYQ